MSSLNIENQAKSTPKDNSKTDLPTFKAYVNELTKKLHSSIALELIKVSQTDLSSEIKSVLSSNEIKDALRNELCGIIDKYTLEAHQVKTNCLNEITQFGVALTQYCQLNLNNSLNESIGFLNSLSNCIEKIVKDTQGNIKGVLFGLKSLSTHTNGVGDSIKKQKTSKALEKIEHCERLENELSNQIRDIKEGHEVFFQETKGIFKQIKELIDDKSKHNKSKSPVRSDLKGKSIKTMQASLLTSSSSSQMNKNKRQVNCTTITSLSKENSPGLDQFHLSSDSKAMQTVSSNKSLNQHHTSISHLSKSPILKTDSCIVPDSIYHLKQKIKDINKTNTELKSKMTKEKTEKAFLLKEIGRLNGEIEKYKSNGLTLNDAVTDIIKSSQLKKMFSMKDFNSQLKKISTISKMTIGFANSLRALQDSMIKRSSTTIELKVLYDNLKRTLVQIVNDISGISQYMTNQYCYSLSGLNKHGFSDDNSDNDNRREKREGKEELQNEVFELKTQIALLNSQHIEEISKMQKEHHEEEVKTSLNLQHQTPVAKDVNELNQLKEELNIKAVNEKRLIKEIEDLKAEEIAQCNFLRGSNQHANLSPTKYNEVNTQNDFDMIKLKNKQNLEQLGKIYQDTIDHKEKSLKCANEINNQLKLQIEKLTTERNALEAELSSNLIQYEIDLSNSQNERMQMEILLEESRSCSLMNEKRVTELTEALKEKEETSKHSNNKKNSEDNSSLSLHDDNKSLNQKIIELTSIIESQNIIEHSLTERYEALLERVKGYESKEKESQKKLRELTDYYSEEKDKNDTLVIDKMLLVQKIEDFNNELIKCSQGNKIIIKSILQRSEEFSFILPSNYLQANHALSVSQTDDIEIRGNRVVKGKQSHWEKLEVLNPLIQIEFKRDETMNKGDKQLISKQKEELALLKSKLKTTLEQNDAFSQKIEEIEANFNSEKEEYVGMLRVAFEKLISEIQITSKSKEFTTVIMRMLNYSDDDIFDIYNSGKKKTLFGFLK